MMASTFAHFQRNFDDILSSQLPFVKHISHFDQITLSQNCRIFVVEKHENIFSSSSHYLKMVIILSGKIKEMIVCRNGKEVCLAVLEKDDIHLHLERDLEMNKNESYLVAEVDSVVLSLTIDEVFYNQYASIIEPFIIKTLVHYYRELAVNLLEVVGKKLPARLASLLLELSDKINSSEIQVSHEELSSYLNSTREQISRILSKFSKDSLIKLGYRKVIIKDFKGLEKISKDI